MESSDEEWRASQISKIADVTKIFEETFVILRIISFENGLGF